MTDRKLAERYARALLASLADEDEARKTQEILDAIAVAMDESPELRDVLLNPAVARGSRRGILTAIADRAGAPRHLRNFLAVVVDHNRIGSIPAIAAVYREVREAGLGIVPVTVTTAVPLDDDLAERTKRAIEKLTGGRVRLSREVDPAVLGGAVTRIGSQLYDGSLRTQLAALRRRMVQE